MLNSKGGNADAAVPDLLMLSGQDVPDTPTRTAQRGPMARMESVDSVRLVRADAVLMVEIRAVARMCATLGRSQSEHCALTHVGSLLIAAVAALSLLVLHVFADPHQAQEQADAALARQIMAEEDAAARSYQQRAHNQYNAQPASDDRFAQLNYQPRQRPTRTGAPSAPYAEQQRHDGDAAHDQSTQPMGAGLSAGAREDIDQAVQTVKNAAAEGKRMAIGLFGQLKAKVGELQNPKPADETCGGTHCRRY